MSGLILRIERGSSSVIIRRMVWLLSAPNGGRPVHIAYSTQPRLNRSDREPSAFRFAGSPSAPAALDPAFVSESSRHANMRHEIRHSQPLGDAAHRQDAVVNHHRRHLPFASKPFTSSSRRGQMLRHPRNVGDSKVYRTLTMNCVIQYSPDLSTLLQKFQRYFSDSSQARRSAVCWAVRSRSRRSGISDVRCGNMPST